MQSNLIFISAQPHDQYFVWQCEVLITNFREHKISDKVHILVWYPKEGLNGQWSRLQRKYPEVKFFFYQDIGLDLNTYIPIIRPYILKVHFEKFKDELKNKVFFYHDSDIIFNFLPDFNFLCTGDINWQSDTSGYLDYGYLTRKEAEGRLESESVVSKLAEIGRISIDTIKEHLDNSGGAQYILKGIDSGFWEDVEKDCMEIRKFLLDINKKHFPSENAGFQSWCADMWAVNFNLWNRNKVTKVTDKLDFSWATDSIETYNKKPIFHNAGATANNRRLFYKGAWINKSPIGRPIQGISRLFASSKYVEAIQKVK